MNSQKNFFRPNSSRANSKSNLSLAQIDTWQQHTQFFASQPFAQEPIHDTASNPQQAEYGQSDYNFLGMGTSGLPPYAQDYASPWFYLLPASDFAQTQQLQPQILTPTCVSPFSLDLNTSIPHMEPTEAAALCSPFVLDSEASKPNNSDRLKAKTAKAMTKAPRKVKSLTSFPCDHQGCLRIFSRRYNLDSHRRTHVGHKSHACEVADCNKSFLRKSDLSRHTRKHTKERPFACALGCAEEFARTEPRLRHYKRDHPQAYNAQKQ